MQFPHDEYNTSNMLNKDRSIAFVESDKVWYLYIYTLNISILRKEIFLVSSRSFFRSGTVTDIKTP